MAAPEFRDPRAAFRRLAKEIEALKDEVRELKAALVGGPRPKRVVPPHDPTGERKGPDGGGPEPGSRDAGNGPRNEAAGG